MKTLLIAFTMRCGSNFLCNQLRINGIGAPSEYFQHPFGIANKVYYDEMGVDPDDFARFIDLLPKEFSQNGVFATKLAWDHKNVLLQSIRSAHPEVNDIDSFFPDSKWVFIKRRNKILQAISLWIAKKTGLWMKTPDTQVKDELPEYRFFEIIDSLMHILVEEHLWEEYFSLKNIQPLTLYYEDFEVDPRGAVLEIARYIDVANDLNLHSVEDIKVSRTIIKQRTDYSDEVYSRFLKDLWHLGIESYWKDRSSEIDRWKGYIEHSKKSDFSFQAIFDHIPIDIGELRLRGANIGEGVFIGPGVYIEREFAPLLTIEDGVVLSKGVTILLHDSALNNVAGEPIRFAPVRLRRHCYIGANATILCGVEIGERAIVGAGSLVTSDIPPDTYAYGHPARVRGKVQDLISKHRQLAQSPGRSVYLPLEPWRNRRDKWQSDQYIREFLLETAQNFLEDHAMTSHQETFFSSADFDPKEVQDILERIDQNLASRLTAHAPDQSQTNPSVTPALPGTDALEYHFYEIKRSTAPLFAVTGRSPKQLLRRVLNVPIKVFGYKQKRFNSELVHFLEHIIAQIYGLRGAVGQIKDLHEQIRSLSAQIHTVVSDLRDLRQRFDRLSDDLHSQLEQLAGEQRGQRDWLEQVAAEQRGQRDWLEQVAAEQRGQRDWVSILERKHQMLALDVRELVSNQHVDHDFPEPRIVDPERYQERLVAMISAIRVNLGCGEKPLPGYINVDYRELPDVDIVADARRLPFADESLSEIASFHLVEHFREHHLRKVVLPYWYRLLRKGGMIRIVCPNWSAMIERLNDGRMSLEQFKLITFGAQDYEGDDHFAMYTPETLIAILQEAGFTNVETVVLDRMNGICPEMEIIAYRP